MKRHNYLFATLIIAVLFTSCDKTTDTPDDPYSWLTILNKDNIGAAAVTPLVANNSVTVGEVALSVTGENLTVTYMITKEGYMLSETNLAVGDSLTDIPQTVTGNPITDDFEYSTAHDPYVMEYTYNVSCADFSTVVVAAHAYVATATGQETCLSVAQLQGLLPTSNVPVSIVDTTVYSRYRISVSGAGELDGKHLAWCIDNNHKDATFTSALLLSSYSSSYDLSKVVPTPANLPHLNYLMNKYYILYSYPVIQAAIWRLMNGSFTNPSGGINLTAEQMTQFETITADALANGGNFLPGGSDYLVVLVHSGDIVNNQNIFFLFKKCTPVFSDEIAWGQGQPFAGNSWAKYFGFSVK